MPITVPIPAWNPEGLIPPVDASNPASTSRSPYRVSLADLVLRFSTTPERKAILDGLLDYRSTLRAAGLVTGFQWVDGSFVEDIETNGFRPPNDIDVVTFFELPAGITQASLMSANPLLFPTGPGALVAKIALKSRFHVDAYFVNLGSRSERLIERGCYWYGMWAHQRKTQKWKGFVEIDLDPADDAHAQSLIGPTPTGATP